MITMHMREHEVGPKNPRIRVWSEEMQAYGQFNICEFDKLKRFIDLSHELEFPIQYVLHHCDTVAECKCQPLGKFSTLELS